MGLWDKLKGELIDIIEWLDDSQDSMVYRFPRHDNEIKYGAKLIVRESQVAIFINEGRISQPQPEIWNVMDFKEGDVFQPGTYTLETKNLPILSTLKGWKYGFSSPFKAEVYFISTRTFTNQKWGTPNPIMLRDAEFGPVRLRAFGTYTFKIKDPVRFLLEIVGTSGHFTIDGMAEELRNMIVSRFTDVLGESKIPALDLAANYDELGEFVAKRIRPEIESYGLELGKFYVSNISLPEAVQQALDKRSSMGIIGDLSKYAQYQAAESLGKAAENPSGLAGAGLAMGAGLGMAEQMRQAFNQPPPAAAPPPLPAQAAFHLALNGQSAGPFDLDALRRMAQSGQLSRDTLAWKQGMAQWIAAGQVAELAGLFAAVPPPVPR